VPRLIPLFWVLLLLFNVLLNLLFVPGYGARAAALSSSLSYALVFLFITIYFQRRTGNSLSQTFIPRVQELRRLLRIGRA
jgi:Na+-driven multidrug efflux pump